MFTVVIGVRHRTAPIEIREKLAFSQEETPDALREMLTYPGILEAAILSTCNRTEVYATVSDTEIGIRSLKSFLSDYKRFDYNSYMHYAFILLHEDAVMHLFRVSSGLDSLVLGEGQILAQVKESLKTAMLARTSGEIMEKIFKTALSVGKAVRSETGIANRDISVSRAAYEFARTQHPEFLQGSIALIGAGKMAEILMSSLKSSLPADSRKPEQIVLVNRTPERVKALSDKYGFPGYGWEEMERIIRDYDTLFVATSSPHYLLKPELFSNLQKPKVIIDISVPRNVDPLVGEMPGVSLYNTDNLSGYCGYTGENRMRLIKQAHQIIEREYQKYHQWTISRTAVPVITQFRARVEDIRRSVIAELETACPKIQQNCDMIDELSRALVNKIIHDPTVRLRSTPQMEEIFIQAEFLSRLFNIPAMMEESSSADLLSSSPAPTADDSQTVKKAVSGAKVLPLPVNRK